MMMFYLYYLLYSLRFIASHLRLLHDTRGGTLITEAIAVIMCDNWDNSLE